MSILNIEMKSTVGRMCYGKMKLLKPEILRDEIVLSCDPRRAGQQWTRTFKPELGLRVA